MSYLILVLILALSPVVCFLAFPYASYLLLLCVLGYEHIFLWAGSLEWGFGLIQSGIGLGLTFVVAVVTTMHQRLQMPLEMPYV